MRLLIAFIAVLAAHATTASGPCPTSGFTLSHLTIANCQTSVTYNIPNAGTFTPLNLISDGLVLPNVLDISEPGSITLSSGPATQSFDGTITANFTMDPGWSLSNVQLLFVAQDDGISVGENVFLTSPCVAAVPGDSSGVFSCSPATPASSGTINLRLSIHSDAICPMCFADSGQVGGGQLILFETSTGVPTPEPGTGLLPGLSLILTMLIPPMRQILS